MIERPAEPGQVGERGKLGDRQLVAVEDEAAEHDGTRDPRRRPPADQWRECEGDRPAREREQEQPDGVAGRGADRDVVAGERRERAADEGDRDEDQDHRDRERDDVSEQLLKRDPSSAERCRGDELEAAAVRLRGERPGQGEDRPEAHDQREERAVLVGDVPAERVHRDGPAGQALQDRRHGRDDVDEALRDAAVANSDTIALLTPIRSSPRTTPTTIVARRESRIVLPKTLPRP